MKNELSIEQIADYILEKDLINKNITIQVYEEIVHLGHFLNSLKPHNILEIGARGGTFLLFSKLSTGTKIAVDIETPIVLKNIKILPYSYHRYWEDGGIKDVYRAGGNTQTKFETIKKMLI